jgi:hypothetical protein
VILARRVLLGALAREVCKECVVILVHMDKGVILVPKEAKGRRVTLDWKVLQEKKVCRVSLEHLVKMA